MSVENRRGEDQPVDELDRLNAALCKPAHATQDPPAPCDPAEFYERTGRLLRSLEDDGVVLRTPTAKGDTFQLKPGMRAPLPPTFLRDLRALDAFLAAYPLESCYADRKLLLRLYVRAGAVYFSLCGSSDAVREALGHVHVQLGRAATETLHKITGSATWMLDLWLLGWFRVGCPRIKLRREEAAALALTDMPDAFADAREAPSAPWGSFMVDVPPGALWIDDPAGPLAVDRILMFRVVTNTASFWITTIGCGSDMVGIANSMLALAADDPRRIFYRWGLRMLTESAARGILAAARIAAGACYALENRIAERKTRLHRAGPPSRVGGPPTTSDYILGLPIEIDFSEALADFTLHRKPGMRKSQWVVRGHWRNQAVGKGRADHRRTWIKPFWKGPAHLPILVRAHRLVDPGGSR